MSEFWFGATRRNAEAAPADLRLVLTGLTAGRRQGRGGGSRVHCKPAAFGVDRTAAAEHRLPRYSPAFARLVGTWTLAEFNAFIASPVDHVPGTTMGFAGAIGVRDKVQRANLIAFLRLNSDDPLPLPAVVSK